MEHIAAVLLLIGCSGDFKDCREIPASVPLFEVEEECHAQLGVALRGIRGSYARTMGTCVSVDPAEEDDDADLVWHVAADGKLTAFVTAPQLVASNHAAQAGYIKQE